MKILQNKYKTQYKYVVNKEKLLSITVTKISLKKDVFKSFLICNQSTSNEDEVTDEYVTYCQLPTFKTTSQNLITWWREQESSFPLLTTLTYTILVIPVMNTECEHVFNSAKLLITSNRNRLSTDTIK